MRGFDHDVQKTLKEETIKRGIKVLTQTSIERIKKHQESGALHCELVEASTGPSTKKQKQAPAQKKGVVEADVVLCATGRKPNTQGLGLEGFGVQLHEDAVIVDTESGSTVPHIYAVGDVTNRLNLTPVALAEVTSPLSPASPSRNIQHTQYTTQQHNNTQHTTYTN